MGRDFRGRGRRRAAATTHHQHNGVALFGRQPAQLVLDIDAVRSTQIEQIFALHVEFARQNIDPDFVFFLQAELLLCRLRYRPPASRSCNSPGSFYSNLPVVLEKRFLPRSAK
jgi:hypothetical protein